MVSSSIFRARLCYRCFLTDIVCFTYLVIIVLYLLIPVGLAYWVSLYCGTHATLFVPLRGAEPGVGQRRIWDRA